MTVVNVSIKTAGERLFLEVANDGEQIPAEQHEAIFEESFMQDIAHHHQGSGLSLALARRVIEAHEGRLSVTNHAKGPVFAIDMKL